RGVLRLRRARRAHAVPLSRGAAGALRRGGDGGRALVLRGRERRLPRGVPALPRARGRAAPGLPRAALGPARRELLERDAGAAPGGPHPGHLPLPRAPPLRALSARRARMRSSPEEMRMPLVLSLLLAAAAPDAARAVGYYRTPAIHGDVVVFAAEGDL